MSVNKVILLGHLGKDPEVRYLDGGVAVASITLATSERAYTTKSGVQVPERTEWHNLVLWRGLAETAEKYLKKGDKLYVEGKIRTRSYDDQAGIHRYITEVFVDLMEMLTPKQRAPLPTDPAAPAPAAAAQTGYASSAPAQPTQASMFPTGQQGTKDDLPF